MFNTFKKILNNQPISTEDSSKVSDFILQRWLSGNSVLAFYANELNARNINYLKMENVLNVLSNNIKGLSYIEYPKYNKNTYDSETEKLVNFIMENYRVSKVEALEYVRIIQNAV